MASLLLSTRVEKERVLSSVEAAMWSKKFLLNQTTREFLVSLIRVVSLH